MWNNRMLTASTLAGLLLAVAFTTSIPMYADGSLKRVVSASLQENNSGLPAGTLLIRYQTVGSERPDLASFQDLSTFIREEVPARVQFPYHNFVQQLSIRSSRVSPVDPQKVDASKQRQMAIASLSELEKHIEITQGKMFSDEIKDGVIEAVVLEESLFRNFYRVGDEFTYPLRGAGSGELTVRVVGAFQPKAGEHAHDVYWFQGIDGLVNTFLISENVFYDDLLVKQNIPLDTGLWYYNFDLREIETSDLSPLTRTLERLDIELFQLLKNTRVDISFAAMLDEFRTVSLQLQTLLFTLAAPMIAMVFYYIAMISRQSLDRQRSDIAVIRSRGGSTKQIIWLYLLEGLILGGIALVIGPLIGWFMAKSIGSSSGFLTFVNRKAIPVDVSPGTLLYGVAAVLIALAASLIPAIQYARSSIVGLKQQLAREGQKPLWQRLYLDIVAVGLSAYGWYLFSERQLIFAQTGLTTDQLQVQPLLFFVPALTVFALGLLFLRLFPWFLRLFHWLGKKFLPVPLYITLLQLSRSAKGYYPLMLLLILTLGLGVYNASAARTIDLNTQERTLYKYGTDVKIQTVWTAYSENPAGAFPGQGGGRQTPGGGQSPGGGQTPGGGEGEGAPQPPPNTGAPAPPPVMRYVEPPFEIFRELPGVEHAARVLLTTGNAVVSGRSAGQGMVMGIDNVDFYHVGWFEREDLFPYPPEVYLDMMGDFGYGEAVLVSAPFAEKYQLKRGDLLTINIQQQPVEFVIVGILPYWPSLFPEEMPFFIANLDYIYDQVPMIPYEVWLKMEDGAKTTPVIEALQEKGIPLAKVEDVRIELAQQERHPSRGGVFGILSLGFIVSALVSFVGYVLYWFFNLSSRVVQFGVLRAMGLSRRQLTGMLLLEQVLTAGLSIVVGIGLGRLTSYLFLPFLQTAGNMSAVTPPFRVIFEARDTMQLYAIVFVMMLVGAGFLFLHIRRLRVHQAVKLGEER
jgi:putative ABC transport system permease protein